MALRCHEDSAVNDIRAGADIDDSAHTTEPPSND